MEVTTIFFLCVLGVSFAQKCPALVVNNCRCETKSYEACYITCSGAFDQQIEQIAGIPDLCDGNVHLNLAACVLQTGIPSKLWKKLLASNTVDVSIDKTIMQELVRPGDAAIGKVYTPGSATIRIVAAVIKTWKWNQFKQFFPEKGLSIEIYNTILKEIGKDFSEIANGRVTKISIENAVLANVYEKAFANFADLQYLSLKNNLLKSVSRSMIVNPAMKLKYINLSGNLLFTLPPDMFVGMPVIEHIILYSMLPQEIFRKLTSPVVKQPTDLINNPWQCDCDLRWIIYNTHFELNMGYCASPKEYAGRKVNQVVDFLKC